MTLRRRLVDWSLAALLLLVPAMILRASLSSGEPGGFGKAVLRISAPLSASVGWVVDGLGGAWSRYVGLIGIEDENRELRRDNERLRRELAAAKRRTADIEALEDAVAAKKLTPADTVGARVVASSLSPFYRVMRIRIDRGAPEVQPGMPVVTSHGLVGRVAAAYGGHADVLLVTDAQSSIDITIPRTGSRGVLSGLGADSRYGAKIQWLDKPADAASNVAATGEQAVQVGDAVVTSGLGAAFPAGIPVGVVAEVERKDYTLFQELKVEPAVDVASLRAVLVLLAPPPPPDPDAGKRGKSEPAFGVRPL